MYELLLRRIKHKPLFLFLLTFFVTIFASYLSKNIDPHTSGILVITITLIPLIQVMTKLIELEEFKEEKLETNLIMRHKDFIINYFAIFFGAVFGFYVSYILISPSIFLLQEQAIEDIKAEVLSIGKVLDKETLFSYILFNNLKVLIISFLFSFLFGAGAIYIILWNASIVGVFLGKKALSYVGDPINKFVIYPLYKLLLLLPHGILEFLAYFTAALAGGIMSIALLKHLRRKVLERIIIDSILLFVSSILILILAAFVEAYL